MTPVHRIRLADCADQPWRNGGGTTRELLAWPHADGWALRLSVARIDRDGAFSAFSGITRHFAVLDGAGVCLRWPTGQRRITPSDAPLDFDGANPPHCTLIDGPTVDLNLMVVRSQGNGRLHRARRGQPWRSAAPWRGVFATGPVQLRRKTADAVDQALGLPGHTLLWGDSASGETWSVAGEAAAWWIEFEPRDAAPGEGGRG